MSQTITLGRVSRDESQELKGLIERKMGLSELAKTLTNENREVYEQIVTDLGDTEFRIRDWWSRMSISYQWEMIPGANLRIDFNTAEIIEELPGENTPTQVF